MFDFGASIWYWAVQLLPHLFNLRTSYLALKAVTFAVCVQPVSTSNYLFFTKSSASAHLCRPSVDLAPALDAMELFLHLEQGSADDAATSAQDELKLRELGAVLPDLPLDGIYTIPNLCEEAILKDLVAVLDLGNFSNCK